MQRHYRRTTGSSSSNGARWQYEDQERISVLSERNRIRARRTPPVVKPRRAVERAPLILLPPDAMEALYDEQHLRAVAPPFKATKTASGLPKKTHRQCDHAEPHDEPRVSDGSSRPRTSTSSSLAPPTPQPADADEAAIARVFEHSIVLESAVQQMQMRATQLATEASFRDCQVCYERIDASDVHSCSTCRGAFCAGCMRWYMEYKILEGEVSEKKLVCPAPQCMRPLPEDYVKQCVSPSTFDKYLQYRENQRPGVRFCPRPGCCSKLDEPLNSTSRRAQCTSCGHESCMRCGDAFHLVPACRRKEKHYGKWRKRSNVRKCPSCKTDIEKQGGCAHMRCFQCDAEFCWSCLRPWDAHDETLCLPLSFLRSKDPRFGCCKPVRAVTKTFAVGAAVVVGATGVGVAAVVLPPLLLVHWVRSSSRFQRRDSLHSEDFFVE